MSVGSLSTDLISPDPPGPAAAVASDPAPYPWIISPVFDMLFVVGGAVAIFFAATYLVSGWGMPTGARGPGSAILLTCLYLSQHLFADAHNMATYTRLWGSAADRTRFKFYRTWLAYSCLPLFVLGLIFPAVISWLVYLYVILVYWHYASQAFGVALIYCYKRKYFLTKFEKGIFKWFILAMSAFVAMRFLTGGTLNGSSWYGVPMPRWGVLPPVLLTITRGILIALASAFLVVVLRKEIVHGQFLPVPAALVIMTVACIGLLSGTTGWLIWFWAPAFFHGSQYLAITLAYELKERGMEEGMDTSQIARAVWSSAGLKYMAWVVTLGVALYVGIPHFFSQLGYDYWMIAGLVLGVVNYHHFITDAAIWKLRDRRCRQILLA